MRLQEVHVPPIEPARLETVIGQERTARFEVSAAAMRDVLRGRRVFNVNSTATGGGVAELLRTLLANARGVGIDTRWLVIEGDPEFFAITKRLHNHLYGATGDGGPLDAKEHEQYEATMAANAGEMVDLVRPGDVVILHDPQTAGLAPRLRATGVHLVWRCHVGIDAQNECSRRGWDFLRRYIDEVPAFVFSCEQFAPPWISPQRLFVIPPSIDPFSAKNEPMTEPDVRRLLQRVGLLGDDAGDAPVASSGRIGHMVDLLGTGPPPPADVPIVLQASRWDALKDMPGVMTGFAERVSEMGTAHLVLAGPTADGVADDPEADAVLATCLESWRSLPASTRRRVHLASVSMSDGDHAASVVNALQRHASVVVQKSLAEGFGLTVAEAMWKSRPVVGSAVGGIVDQIVPGETGWLLADPHDLATFAARIAALVADPTEADRMGRNGQSRAREHFLGDRHLQQWAELLTTL